MRPCPLPGTGPHAFVDLACVRTESANQAPDCYFTDQHHALIGRALALATSWVQRSLGLMRFGTSGRQLAVDQARTTFGTAAPAFAELERQAQVTLAVLRDPSVELLGATCGDSTCNSRPYPIAYRVAGQRQLRFCPRTFLDVTDATLARTILHECLHIAGQPADANDP
jgi:hypothetical protein